MIKNKVIGLVIGLKLLIPLIALSCGPAEPAKPAVEEPEDIWIVSTPIGTAFYIMAATLQEASSDHPLIRLVHTESPGGKYCRIQDYTNRVWQKNTISPGNTTSPYLAKNGLPPFGKVYPAEDVDAVKNLVGATLSGYGFVTLDPNIKTWKDLDGKRLGMGTKAQTAYYTLPVQILEAAYPQITTENLALGTKPAVDALMDGKVDAAISAVRFNHDASQVELDAPLIKLTAHPKPFHFVQLDKEAIALGGNPAFYGGGVMAFTVPENAIEVSPEAFTILGWPVNWVAHESFDDWKAKAFVELYLASYEEMQPRHKILNLVSEEMIVKGLTKKNTHRGAIQAYEEAGITLPEG